MPCYAGGVTGERALESLLQWAKRRQARFHARAYRELERERRAGGESPAWRLPGPVRDILVFKPDEIGDAVFALPAVASLRRAFPEARLALVCGEAARPIYERTALFDDIVSVKVTKRLLRFPSLDLSGALSRLACPRPDVAIFLRTYPAFFRHFLRIPARSFVHPRDPRLKSRSPFQSPVSVGGRRPHQAWQLLELVAPLTGEPPSTAAIRFPAFRWTDADGAGVARALGPALQGQFLVVHPYARYETRRYPHWEAVLDAIGARYRLPIVLVGGAGDPPFRPAPGRISLVGRLSLGETGYLISRAAAFLGNESGPAHWAAALGAPTVVFFGGHSSREEWAPIGDTLLLGQAIGCSPCHRRYCPGLGVACLAGLKPEEAVGDVFRFLDAALSRPPKGPRGPGRTPGEISPG